MAAGNTRVVDLLDTVHHEIDSVAHSHHVYKSVWSPVKEQLIQEKELYWPHMINLPEIAVAVI